MSDPAANPSPSRRRLRANRIWLTVVPSLASAILASWLVPARYALLAFVATGAGAPVVYWWVWGRVFRNVGLVVK